MVGLKKKTTVESEIFQSQPQQQQQLLQQQLVYFNCESHYGLSVCYEC